MKLLKTLFLEIKGWLKNQLIIKMLQILYEELWAKLNALKFDGRAARSIEISVFDERKLIKKSTNSKNDLDFFSKVVGWISCTEN